MTSALGPSNGAPVSVGLLADMAASRRTQTGHLPSLIYMTENADADDLWNPLTNREQVSETLPVTRQVGRGICHADSLMAVAQSQSHSHSDALDNWEPWEADVKYQPPSVENVSGGKGAG